MCRRRYGPSIFFIRPGGFYRFFSCAFIEFVPFSIAEQVLTYNQANRAVAVLCNHRKTASKNFDDQMTRMGDKISAKEELIAKKKKELKSAKRDGVSIFVFRIFRLAVVFAGR